MKIDLHVDTTNMSKEARLALQAELEQYLSKLRDEIAAMDKSETVNDGSETFCGIPFNLEGMEREALRSQYEEARKLWSAILAEGLPNNRIDHNSKVFFGKEFKFGIMSREQLASIKKDAKDLLTRIENQMETIDGTSSDSTPP